MSQKQRSKVLSLGDGEKPKKNCSHNWDYGFVFSDELPVSKYKKHKDKLAEQERVRNKTKRNGTPTRGKNESIRPRNKT